MSNSTESEFYGACGCEGCAECTPRYDADNNPVADEDATA